MESTNSNSKLNYSNSIKGPGMIPQILLGLSIVVLLYLSFLFIELLYSYYHKLNMNKTELLPVTYNTENKSIVIPQNPNDPKSKLVNLSDNERSGIEFTYTFYTYVHPSTFRTEKGLLHIFHKGYPGQFPLLAPGVYMRSDTNTMRIYMNTYKTWNNYVEVDNFPVAKWVFVAIVCTSNSLEVFINGNLAKKLNFEKYQPYQNYQDIICFSSRRITVKHSSVPSTDENGQDVFGTMKGMLSKLYYFNYALSYSEINSLMNEGPSTKMDSADMNGLTPPYLDDTWWTKSY
jgi:hypothetical protein